jgi:hypothetical protein
MCLREIFEHPFVLSQNTTEICRHRPPRVEVQSLSSIRKTYPSVVMRSHIIHRQVQPENTGGRSWNLKTEARKEAGHRNLRSGRANAGGEASLPIRRF